jgi:hemoglobin
VAPVPSVYEWAGGSEAFERLTEIFYRRHVLSDEVLGPVFARMPAEHPHHVALWLAEVFGGPAEYSERHGGYTRTWSPCTSAWLSPSRSEHAGSS